MVSLEAAELTLLLKLLGCEGYRSDVLSLAPSRKTSVAQRDRICVSLSEKGLVEYEKEIARFVIAPPGRTLLTLDSKNILLTPDEFRALKACKGSMTPEKLLKIPESSRQGFIRGLAERGLVKVTKQAITQVWLSERGKQFLLHEYVPEGERAIASATLFGHYVRFLRTSLSTYMPMAKAGDLAVAITREVNVKPTEEVLTVSQTQPHSQPHSQLHGQPLDRKTLVKHIRQLDQALKTNNRLPIFYLRERVQPPLTFEELNDMLEALERNHRLMLMPLVPSEIQLNNYTETQVASGIQKEDGRCLFFIALS